MWNDVNFGITCNGQVGLRGCSVPRAVAVKNQPARLRCKVVLMAQAEHVPRRWRSWRSFLFFIDFKSHLLTMRSLLNFGHCRRPLRSGDGSLWQCHQGPEWNVTRAVENIGCVDLGSTSLRFVPMNAGDYNGHSMINMLVFLSPYQLSRQLINGAAPMTGIDFAAVFIWGAFQRIWSPVAVPGT